MELDFGRIKTKFIKMDKKQKIIQKILEREKDDESIHYLDQLRLEELEEQGEYNYDFSFNKDYFRPKDLD